MIVFLIPIGLWFQILNHDSVPTENSLDFLILLLCDICLFLSDTLSNSNRSPLAFCLLKYLPLSG